MIKWKKSGIFVRLCADTAFLSQDLKLESQDYPLHQNDLMIPVNQSGRTDQSASFCPSQKLAFISGKFVW